MQDNLRLTSSQETAILSARSTMLDKLRAIGRQRRQLLSGLAMELLQTLQVRQLPGTGSVFASAGVELLQPLQVRHYTRQLHVSWFLRFTHASWLWQAGWLISLCWLGAAER